METALAAPCGLLISLTSLFVEHGLQGFSSCGTQAQPCSFQALKRRLDSCVARLSRSAACGISPDQGLNLCLLHWQADSLPQGQPKKPLSFVFESLLIMCFDVGL